MSAQNPLALRQRRTLKDMTGFQSGKLTALFYLGKSTWRCRCECGNHTDVPGGTLRRKAKLNCGCSAARTSWEPIALPDGCVGVPLTREKVAVIDAADLELVRPYVWSANSMGGKTWYVVAGGAQHLMHRLIMGAGKGQLVDHRDGDGLNNRRSNLRLATKSQNAQNMENRVRGTSRFKGVFWWKRDQNWCAAIKIDGVRKNLGYYATEEEAARAYDAAARLKFGEFARLNFPDQGREDSHESPPKDMELGKRLD